MNYQLINLDPEDLETPIFRVFNFQRLLELFSSKKNTLVRPALWDDPLENYVLRVAMNAFNDHPHNFDFSTKDRFYGQCWSMLEESDAMWRIYSPEKTGVKVKTTISNLLQSLSTAQESSNGKHYVGKVKYLADETLRAKLQDRFWLSAEAENTDSQAASLLFKRLEFEHEKEIRLIYLNNDQQYADNLFRYSVDPAILFDEIQFDPRLSGELFDVFRYFLEEKIGYKKQLTRSELYKVPQLTI